MFGSFLFGFSYLSPNSKKVLSFFGKSYFDSVNQLPLIETGLKQVSINDRYNSYDRLSWYFLNPSGVGSYYSREEGYLRSQLTGQSQVWFSSQYSGIIKKFIPSFMFEPSAASVLVPRKKTSIHFEKFKVKFNFDALSTRVANYSHPPLRYVTPSLSYSFLPNSFFYVNFRAFRFNQKLLKKKKKYLGTYKYFLLLKNIRSNINLFGLVSSNYLTAFCIPTLFTTYSSSFFKQYRLYRPFLHRSFFIQKITSLPQTSLTLSQKKNIDILRKPDNYRYRIKSPISVSGPLGHPSFLFNTFLLSTVRKKKRQFRHTFVLMLRRFFFF